MYKLAIEYKMAFPLHPEFRTMPMVWYCPPLSPIMSYFEGENAGQNPDMIFPAIEGNAFTYSILSKFINCWRHKTC